MADGQLEETSLKSWVAHSLDPDEMKAVFLVTGAASETDLEECQCQPSWRHWNSQWLNSKEEEEKIKNNVSAISEDNPISYAKANLIPDESAIVERETLQES